VNGDPDGLRRGPNPLRRPADLAAVWTGPRHRAVDPVPMTWPPGFAASAEDRDALLVLLGLVALTPRRLLELALDRGSASSCLAAVRAGLAGSHGDQAAASRADPARIREQLGVCDARLVAVGDADYPAALLDLFDPPAGVFLRGRPLPSDLPAVAIVGARNCSALGKETARAMGNALARAGICVVSGAARGIDGEAHRGAIVGGGATVAVLGSGIDVPYPPAHRGLLAEVAASGTVVGEYPPGVPAEPFRFPARNRIIAALSRAVVVVEGADGSGSMITADHALEIGRDVFALPGPITSPLAAAPLSLIRQGATMIRGPADLLEDLGLDGPAMEPAAGPPGLDPATRSVWEALSGPSTPDQVARSCRLTVAAVMPLLVGLELQGLVRNVGGRYERRLAPG